MYNSKDWSIGKSVVSRWDKKKYQYWKYVGK